MKSVIKISLSLLIIAIAIHYSIKLYQKYSMVEADINKVSAVKGDIEIFFNETGILKPARVKDIYSPVNGTISEIFVKEGDEVEKGKTLLIIKPGVSDVDKFIPIEIKSPVEGVVIPCSGDEYNNKRQTIKEVGEKVSGSMDYNPSCIMRIADVKNMVVELQVNETDVLKIKRQMNVEITIDAINKKTKGKVSYISLIPSPSSGKYPVKIDISERINALSGMKARVKVLLEKRKNVIKIPLAALFSDSTEEFVYIYNPQTKKARKQKVITGIRNETEIEIIEGVKENDQLYTDRPLNIEND